MKKKFGTIEFYERRLGPKSQRFRWRFRYANGKKGPNGGEGFSSLKEAERSAFDLIGVSQDYVDHRGQVEFDFSRIRREK